MKKRFIIIVLDGFGIGAMPDAAVVRPGDEKANTLRSILEDYPDLKLPTLEKLGLMNAYGRESKCMKYSEDANFGKSELMHFGADTFMGHQEIMGTLPRSISNPCRCCCEDFNGSWTQSRYYQSQWIKICGM